MILSDLIKVYTQLMRLFARFRSSRATVTIAKRRIMGYMERKEACTPDRPSAKHRAKVTFDTLSADQPRNHNSADHRPKNLIGNPRSGSATHDRPNPRSSMSRINAIGMASARSNGGV